MNKEVAKLWLYENTLTTTATAIGYKNVAQTRYTWFVNMRDVLGETLFNSYEYYVVQIVQAARLNTLPYIYLDGLNIIQTSKNGQVQGGSALIGGLIQTYGTQTQGFYWDSYGANYKYIMTRPVDDRIPLSIYWEPMSGLNGTSTYGSWFFTFQGLKSYNPLYSNPFNSFYNLEQRAFTLTTQALDVGATNEYGTMNSNYSQFTLRNINFRNILGTMWDKYEKFNLIMTSWSFAQTLGSTFNGDQRYTYIIMEGLQFINSVSVGVGSATFYNRYGIGGYGFIESPGGPFTSATSSYSGFDNMSTANTIRKPESENVSLTFTVGNTTVYPSGGVYNDWAISFIIVGIDENI